MSGTSRRGGGGRGSLTRRSVAVSALLSAVIGSAFFLLALAVDTLRNAESRANHTLMVQVVANRLERLVVNIETTQRGYLITGDPSLLEPWYRYRAQYMGLAAAFEQRATAGDEGQGGRAHQIDAAIRSYIDDYSVPLTATAQRDLAAARTVPVTAEGKRRVDALRNSFQDFLAREQQIYLAHQARADSAARWAVGTASVSVAGSIVLILVSGGYLVRSVVRPVRHASEMARSVADGDLAVRMPGTGPAEVGRLERSLNDMTESLQTSRDELRRVADEQAALRRVATLVASEVSPSEVFGAVAAETGRLLDAAATAVARFEQDGTTTVVGAWDRPGSQPTAGWLAARWPTGADSLAGRVLRSGQPSMLSSHDTGTGDEAAAAGQRTIHCGVGSPIMVEGRLWGAVTAFCDAAVPHANDAEQRLLAFTELAAMAVANTENRAQLAASRARVVAAADETRRRIERDLHDGTQQRLISLALDLRAAEARVPPKQRNLVEQWSRTAQGLADAVDELREISRGLHPAILEKGGLEAALRALARRSAVPVELSVTLPGRLPERVEVTAYYVVSEALTNVAKHAGASVAEVDVTVADDVLRLQVRDDGVGGADPSRGSGLVGLTDRVEAAGGKLEIDSPPGRGTTLRATIPRLPG